jgi:hypothetical protein
VVSGKWESGEVVVAPQCAVMHCMRELVRKALSLDARTEPARLRKCVYADFVRGP